MSLGQHLEELRRRLIYCVLVVLGGAFVACAFRRQIMVVLVRPHVLAMAALDQSVSLNYASYFEGFMAQMKACLIVALVATSPFLLYQLWAFVAPGLFPHERSRVMKLFVPSLLCFAAGVTFGYFVFIPTVLHYLLVLAGPTMHPVLMVSSYLSTFFLLTLAMGVAFQTPVVVACLIRWKIVQRGGAPEEPQDDDPGGLHRGRRHHAAGPGQPGADGAAADRAFRPGHAGGCAEPLHAAQLQPVHRHHRRCCWSAWRCGPTTGPWRTPPPCADR